MAYTRVLVFDDYGEVFRVLRKMRKRGVHVRVIIIAMADDHRKLQKLGENGERFLLMVG